MSISACILLFAVSLDLVFAVGFTKTDVLIGINNYKAYIKVKNIEDQYILNGQTFFNGRRWNDDYSIRKQEQTQEHYNDKNQFNHFPQHEYDWDQLEKDLFE